MCLYLYINNKHTPYIINVNKLILDAINRLTALIVSLFLLVFLYKLITSVLFIFYIFIFV